MRTNRRSLWLLMAAGLAWLPQGLLAAPAAEVRSATYSLDIPSQNLDGALQSLALASKHKLLYAATIVDGKTSPALKGEFTAQEAVRRLLVGTNLTFEFTSDGLVLIREKTTTKSSSMGPADQMRVADTSLSKDSKSAPPAEDSEALQNQVVVRSDREKPKPFSTANLDLTRTEDDVLPFLAFTQRDIELSGANGLQEFLQNRLPQNFNTDIPAELDGTGVNPGERANRVNFRGWGVTETVFLLNGRRLAPLFQALAQDTDNTTPDLQGIPLASIERIEILTSAGSAIYGASATGGVINIVTKSNYKGGQVSISYESPADAHAPRRGIDVTYAFPLKDDLNLRVFGAYNDIEPMLAKDRSSVTIERWRRTALERQPSRLLNRTSPQPFGATPNIRTVSTSASANLFSSVPGAVVANFTTVPEGYSGGGVASDFEPGVYNLGMALGSAGNSLYASNSTLGVSSQDSVVGFSLDKNLRPGWQWSLNYRFAGNDSKGQLTGERNFASSNPTNASPLPFVPQSAPTNPFGQNVRVALIDYRLNQYERSTSGNNSNEISSTLRGAFGKWNGFLDFGYSDNEVHMDSSYFWEPIGGWANALATGAYNPFVDVRTVRPASDAFYKQHVVRRITSESATRYYQSTAKANGPVVQLPAGPLQLTVGMEWSHTDRYKTNVSTRYLDSVTGEPTTSVAIPDSDIISNNQSDRLYGFYTRAIYSEMTAPLLSAHQKVPLVERLELFGAGRVSQEVRNSARFSGEPVQYTTKPSVYAFGLQHEVAYGFSYRASKSIGFRPPGMGEVIPGDALLDYGVPPEFIVPITDTLRDDEVVQLPFSVLKFGGNPDLKPETTESVNVGLIFEPRLPSGLRIAIDYVKSVRNDAITPLNLYSIGQLEEQLGRVQRGEPDGHPSGLGVVEFYDSSTVNLREIASRSLDLSLRWVRNTSRGKFYVAAAATKLISFEVQVDAATPPVEFVRNLDYSSASAQQIQWNGNAQLEWENGQWGLGWNTRYFDYILTGSVLLQGGDRAPRAFNHDIHFNYTIPRHEGVRGMQSLLSGTSIVAGVKNVFDRTPRFWAQDTTRGIAPYESIQGRTAWLMIRKSFE